MLFLLKSGSHSELRPGGRFETYDFDPNSEEGTIVESDRDLVAEFGRARFQRISGQLRATAPVQIVTPPKSVDEPTGKPAETPTGVDLGKDVSDEFPDTENVDLRVWLKDGKYYLTTEEDKKTPLNSRGFTKSDRVQKFIDDYTATHHKTEA